MSLPLLFFLSLTLSCLLPTMSPSLLSLILSSPICLHPSPSLSPSFPLPLSPSLSPSPSLQLITLQYQFSSVIVTHQDLQESLQQHQPKLQQLKEDVESLRALVEQSRPGTTKHHDVDSVEKDVEDLTKRWDQICIHVVERSVRFYIN